ncbi:MAG: hypothetical protein JSS02_14880 [Planctomycetes bacterium]|nr:hypothetical protein [Planctomycetota bacterium]
MPDFLLYAKSLGTATLISAACVLISVFLTLRRSPDRHRRVLSNSPPVQPGQSRGAQQDSSRPLLWGAAVASLAGIWSASYVLNWRFVWPPANGLQRWWELVIPGILVAELLLDHLSLSERWAWAFRLLLACVVPRVLLAGSIYLEDAEAGWTTGQTAVVIGGTGFLLWCTWWLLTQLAERTRQPGFVVGTLCLSLGACGACIMLAGYLKGGLASGLVAGTLATVAIATHLSHRQQPRPITVGLGVVSLFSTAVIGVCFGRLRMELAGVICLAPLGAWVAELRWLQKLPGWMLPLVRALLVLVPLIATVWIAKQIFNRDLAPLLGGGRP